MLPPAAARYVTLLLRYDMIAMMLLAFARRHAAAIDVAAADIAFTRHYAFTPRQPRHIEFADVYAACRYDASIFTAATLTPCLFLLL